MISSFYQTFKIDLYYSVNSFIYGLRRTPIFKDLITNDIYKSKSIKRIIGIFGSVISLFRAFLFKYLYYYALLFVCSEFFSKNIESSYYHVLFCLTILGLFINNKLLNASKKKYFALINFQMDGVKYFRCNLLWNIITSFVLNGVSLLVLVNYFKSSYIVAIVLLGLILSSRLIGEYLNLLFYRKKGYIWYSNLKLYYPILLILLSLCILPYFNIIIPFSIIELVTCIFIVFSIYSFIELYKVDDYTILFKRIHNMNTIMNSKEEGNYLRQAMIDVKEKDKEIDTSIIDKKKGYDLFNTIFFERHKEILLRSAKKMSLILIIIYIILGYLMINYSNYNKSIGDFLHIKIAIFIIIMFYINRGSVITRAMFFNCDHAMLRFNFYREPKVILELFKKRLITVTKVNLIPACVIGIGNIILLILSSNWDYTLLITSLLFIISLSIFFSVHYLVLYYLLQPYNKDMEMNKIGYSITTLLTFVICFYLKDIIFSSTMFSILGIVFVIIYIVLSLILVYKVSPRTFKLY